MYIRKNFDPSEFEVKMEDEQMIVEGYATTFGNTDAVNDVIERGAFGKRLTPKKIKFLYQHDMTEPIGTIKEVREDDKGVFIKAKFSDTTRGRDSYTLMKDGAIDAFSIGFRIDEKGWRYDSKTQVRYISKAKLMEVSAVTFPANDKAQVTMVKSLGESGFKTKRDFEEALRFMGFSQKESAIIVSKSYPALESHWDGDCEKGNQSDSDLKKSLENLLNTIKVT
jgi:HK97 family phage prohead protease